MYKIFELIFDENDDEQGLERISLVANPATEIGWQVFNDEIPHTCSTDDIDLTEKGLEIFSEYGVQPDPESFLEAKFSDVEIHTNSHKFWYVAPNPRKFDMLSGDQEEGWSIVRYIYVVDTGVGAPLLPFESEARPGSRKVCRRMITEGRVYSREDINNISRSLTAQSDTFELVPRAKINSQVDFFEFDKTEMKGGNRCRHKWRQVAFLVKPNENYDDALKRIPIRAAQVSRSGTFIDGSSRPFQSEAKYLNRMPKGFSAEKDLQPVGFYMGLFMYPTKFAALIEEPTAKMLTKVKMGEIEGWCPVDIHPEYFEGGAEVLDKFRVKHNFVSVPDYIREAAKRAVDYADENGWGDCGTEVGKKRANDLADPNYNASIETLSRMYSYGSRHKKDWEASKSIDDGCGYLMMLSWGFTPDNFDAAMKYLERQIENATEMNVAFSKDEYRGDITAVVFQPDQKIYRMGEDGRPYYVFMSKDTIKKMLMKVSKNKDQFRNLINYEHSGMVFSGNEIYSYENWLVGDNPKADKSYEIFGREFAPGTWITTLHFNNKRLFEDFVLSNRTTGISLEGMFQEVPFRFMEEVKDEEFVYPNPGESESDFVSRCMGDTQMIGEFPDEEQRAAVCYSYYKEKMEVDNDDYEMVEGVIDLLLQVEDLENRKEIARQVINDFANEGVEYDLEQFLSRLGLSDMTFDFPEGTCWEGYEPYGTKIVGGREVPNCIPVEMKQELEAKDTLDKLREMLGEIDNLS